MKSDIPNQLKHTEYPVGLEVSCCHPLLDSCPGFSTLENGLWLMTGVRLVTPVRVVMSMWMWRGENGQIVSGHMNGVTGVRMM